MKIKNLFIGALAVLSTGFIMSCEKKEEPIIPVEISVEPEKVEVDTTGGSFQLTLTSNRPWTVEVRIDKDFSPDATDDWLTVEPMAGPATAKGEAVTVKVTVKPNMEKPVNAPRQAFVDFKTDKELFATATILQKGNFVKPSHGEGRFTGDFEKWDAIAPVTLFSDDFSSITKKNVEYLNDNWIFYSTDTKELMGWKTGTFNDDKDRYIQIAPYASALEQVVAFALMPKANVAEANSKTYNFRKALYYKEADNSKLEVVASKDFAGNFDTATWEVVKDVTFPEDAPLNVWVDESADLSAYASEKSLCIALRYTGKSNTYRIDDILFGESVTAEPVVTTGEATVKIEDLQAVLKGSYTYDGEEEITEVGFEYKIENETDCISKAAAAVSTDFTVTVDGLQADNVYNYKAYVKMGDKVFYGDEKVFKTSVEETVLTASELSAKLKEMEDSVTLASCGDFVEGIVTANNVGGNLYKTLSVEDGTGEPNSGIYIYDPGVNEGFAIGDKVKVRLLNAKLRIHNDIREIVWDENVYDNDVTIVSSGNEFTTPELAVAGLSDDYLGMYVTVRNLKFTGAEAVTFASDKSLEFSDGENTVAVRTTGYAEWAEETVNPDAQADLSGVVQKFSGNYQILPVQRKDVEAFIGEEGGEPEPPVPPTGKMIGDYNTWNAIGPVTSFFDDFSSITEKGIEYLNDNWLFYSTDGSSVNTGWKTSIFKNEDKYIDIAPYKSELDQVVAFALMPKANVAGANPKTYSFRKALYYKEADDSKLEVVVSKDFAGNFEAATWTVVKDVTFPADAELNNWIQEDVDLSDYASETSLCIALRYTGKSNTYRIDDVKLGDEEGGEPEPPVPPTGKMIGDYNTWNAIASVTSFYDDFSSITEKNKEYLNDNWLFYSTDDASVNTGWKTGVFNEDRYIQIAPYSSSLDQVVAFALMPKANVAGANPKTYSFRKALYYKEADDSKCEVVVSKDFAGNFEAATWTVVKDVTFPADAELNNWIQEDVDLSGYASETSLCIALRYTGKGNTYRIDDVKFGEEGDEPEPPAPTRPVIEGTAGDGVYTSNIEFSQDNFVGEKCYLVTYVIDGEDYPGIKLGTKDVPAGYKIALNKTGDVTLTIYAMAWKNKQTNLLVQVKNGGTIQDADEAELALKTNEGVTNNSPFTIVPGDDFYTINITGATSDTEVILTTEGMSNKRAGFFGVNVK